MSQTLDDKGQGLSLTSNNTESNALDQHVTKLVEPAIASSPNVRRFPVRNCKPPNRLDL